MANYDRLQLRDVVFGEAAINYEEGKFENVNKGDKLEVVFLPDYNRVTVEAGEMQAFAESKAHPHYHYGEYISGSAVRGDAGGIFEKIRSSVPSPFILLSRDGEN